MVTKTQEKQVKSPGRASEEHHSKKKAADKTKEPLELHAPGALKTKKKTLKKPRLAPGSGSFNTLMAMPTKHAAPRSKAKVEARKDSSAQFGGVDTSSLVVDIRRELGVTQDVFARMVGVSARSIAGWESGASINEGSCRRIREMGRLANALKKVMKPDFIATWLVTPNDGMGGISPVEALERGENDRFWRSVFLLGSGLPL